MDERNGDRESALGVGFNRKFKSGGGEEGRRKKKTKTLKKTNPVSFGVASVEGFWKKFGKNAGNQELREKEKRGEKRAGKEGYPGEMPVLASVLRGGLPETRTEGSLCRRGRGKMIGEQTRVTSEKSANCQKVTKIEPSETEKWGRRSKKRKNPDVSK